MTTIHLHSMASGLALVASFLTTQGDQVRRPASEPMPLRASSMRAAQGNRSRLGSRDSANWEIVVDRIVGQGDTGTVALRWPNGIAVDPTGRVYVSDFLLRTVLVFDSTGKFVRKIGRAGQGPGEFQQIQGVTWDMRGRLVVLDMQQFLVFDTSGRPVAQHRMANSAKNRGFQWQGVSDRKGHLLDAVAGPWLTGRGVWYSLVRYDSLYTPTDTSHVLPWVPAKTYAAPPKYAPLTVPFSATPVWAAAPNGDVWFAVTDTYRVMRIGWKGDTLQTLQRSNAVSLPVTDAEVDSVLADPAVLDFIKAGGKVPRSSIPRVQPPIVDVMCDDRGDVWVEVPSKQQSTTTWDVFDERGRYVARAHIPVAVGPIGKLANIKPLIRGNHLYAVTQDADGALGIVIAHIERPSR